MANFRYVEALRTYQPQPGDPRNKVFVAGGIPGVDPTWHDRAIGLLAAADVDMVVLCPRRLDFPVGDVEAGRVQVRWEHEHLHMPDVVTMVWYPESPAAVPQPTSLWETAMALGEGRAVVVGADPGYGRRDILENQLALYPHITLHDTLEATVSSTVAELTRPRSATLQVSWSPDAVRQAVERARAITHGDRTTPDDVYRFGGGTLTWMDLACLVDVGTAFLDDQADDETTPTT